MRIVLPAGSMVTWGSADPPKGAAVPRRSANRSGANFREQPNLERWPTACFDEQMVIRSMLVCLGLARCAVVLVLWLVIVLPASALRRIFVPSRGCGPVWVDALPALAEWLGPAYVKFAQLASTREDVLPASACRAMARLREDGRPIPLMYVRRRLAAHGLPSERFQLVGAGSVACVYLLSDATGRPIAAKLLRPGVRLAIARDLQVLHAGARMLARSRRFRHVPVFDMVSHITEAIAAQTDLARERDNLAALHALLDDSKVVVPRPQPNGSAELLIMEYLPIFAQTGDACISEISRREAARCLVDCVFRMLFVVGVVHCDLHPGNIRVSPDGRICIVDAGFVVVTDRELRREFCEFFLGLTLGDGARCARSILRAAVVIPPTFDRARFDAEVAEVVLRYFRLSAREFSVAAFVDELFALQRRHGVFVSAAFVVPILTLLVIEGSVRSWDPELDFQAVAQPIVLSAIARTAPSRWPREQAFDAST